MTLTDQIGNPIELSKSPSRIISLVPSITETLCDLGMASFLVGRTKFCIHPSPFINSIPKVGGTKNINIDKVKALKPDIIFANKEENQKEQILELSHIPTYTSDIHNLDSVINFMLDLAIIYQENDAIQEKVKSAIADIKLSKSKYVTSLNKNNKVIYLIWKDPYMTIGGDTFINAMLAECGLINIYRKMKRYPEISIEEIKKSKCDFILLSSEPYPFAKKHIREFSVLLPDKDVFLVDGEMFSWYGTRLLKSYKYFELLSAKLSNS